MFHDEYLHFYHNHPSVFMERSDSTWSRHSYPVQSSDIEPPPQGYHTPPEEQEQSFHLPKVLPAVQNAKDYKRKGRTIVVCLDGTGDKFDSDNSNIVHIVGCLKKDDPSQLTYYQSGIGTYDAGGLRNGIAAGLDMAVGSGLGVHIKDAYHFLMHTYKEGDKICLFGFSRGAYTARCLAGMLHKVGLLPARNVSQIAFAYQFYKDDTPEGWKMSSEFKRTFCIDCSVYFVGVFDCVASVGFIPRKLPFSNSPTARTGHFRHAMALDEHRSKFKCCHWQRKDGKYSDHPTKSEAQQMWNEKFPLANGNPHRHINGSAAPNGTYHKHHTPRSDSRPSESEWERDVRLAKHRDSDVLEVWFMGCHADVGGGAVKNEERHKLSQIPLRWMIRQTFACNTGLLFHTEKLAEIGLDIHTLHPYYLPLNKPTFGPSPGQMDNYHKGLPPISRRSTALSPRSLSTSSSDEGVYDLTYLSDSSPHKATGTWIPEQVEDHFDSLAPMNDQLVVAKGWWALEFWPIKYREQRKDSEEWEKKVGVNRGRFRPVQEKEPNLHWTVQKRLEGREYRMRARVGREAVWRVAV